MRVKQAALFSGQGAQYPGMGKELYSQFAAVRRIYACAEDIFGFSVADISFGGAAEEFSGTKTAQPAIFTLSLAAFAAAQEQTGEFAAVAGHSLGEFAALCCAGAFSAEDGMRIIKARAGAMDKAAATMNGSMYAVIGPSRDEIEAACREQGDSVWAVNFNLPTQTVISGESDAAGRAAEKLGQAGAKLVKLQVAGAFHTRLMEGAARELCQKAQDISYSSCAIPFYSGITGERLEIENYPDYFARQMVSPVDFVGVVSALVRDGVEACVEFGPKRTAATLAKKNARGLAVYGVEDLESLEKTIEGLKGANG